MADLNINNVQQECNALKLLLDSKSPELLARFKGDHFGTKDLNNLYRLVSLHFAGTGQILGWDALASEIVGRVKDPQKASFLSDLVMDIKGRDINGMDSDYVIQELEKHRKYRIILDGSGDLLDSVEGQDIDRAVEKLRGMYQSVFEEAAGINFESYDAVNLVGKKSKFHFRQTGIPGIDRRGGLIEGGLTVIGAEQKQGKSTLATQFATFGHDNYEGSTAIFTYEQGAKEIWSRIRSARSGVDLGLIMSDMLSSEETLKVRLAEASFLCDMNDNIQDFVNEMTALDDDEFWPSYWSHFQPRNNRFLLMDHGPDWDTLFVQMEMLIKHKGVKFFVIDYAFLVPRGRMDGNMEGWKYNLIQSQKLKAFARRNKVWVVTPAQYDAKSDSLKYIKGILNDVDLFIKMYQQDEDRGLGDAGAVTVEMGCYRNFLTIPGEPTLQPFKMLRRFDISRLEYFEY